MGRPKLAVIPGDPSGIGPELAAKLLHEPGIAQAADLLLVGDAHMWRRGAEQAGLDIALNMISADQAMAGDFSGCAHLDMTSIDSAQVRIAEVSGASGASSLRCLEKALDLATAGAVAGVLFAPFNKAAMTAGGLEEEDELRHMARYLGYDGYVGEINVLDDLMTTRVTSHIGLRHVADHIDEAGIVHAVELASTTLRRAGIARGAIAVAALNPHAGDNGKFGREEIEILTPAIQQCQERQMKVSGPWPSDTVFLKARRGEVDAVVTMYHDQGQIALKLLGFERGVTLAGGLPIPVTTPAHGTAFDIAGQNRANIGAMRQAFDLLVRLTRH